LDGFTYGLNEMNVCNCTVWLWHGVSDASDENFP